MTAVKELLRANEDGTISFGDYTLPSKTKKEGFEFQRSQSLRKMACSFTNRSQELQ